MVDGDRSAPSVTYILTDEATGEETAYHKVLAGREEGERQAQVAGLAIEGWRQERPNVWYLLPDRRWSIMARTGRQ